MLFCYAFGKIKTRDKEMDKFIEENFVNTFVVKDKRERILYELGSAKKRGEALHRLFYLLDKKFAVLEKSDINEDEITAAVKIYYNINKDCYILSETDDDGKILPFKTALKNMLRYEVNYFIVCGNNTVLACEEYNTYGSPDKIILHKDL